MSAARTRQTIRVTAAIGLLLLIGACGANGGSERDSDPPRVGELRAPETLVVARDGRSQTEIAAAVDEAWAALIVN